MSNLSKQKPALPSDGFSSGAEAGVDGIIQLKTVLFAFSFSRVNICAENSQPEPKPFGICGILWTVNRVSTVRLFSIILALKTTPFSPLSGIVSSEKSVEMATSNSSFSLKAVIRFCLMSISRYAAAVRIPIHSRVRRP